MLRGNPSHERILDLKLLHAKQMTGQARADGNLRGIIQYVNEIAAAAPARSIIGYDARLKAGDYYYHLLSSWAEAYDAYRLAEQHLPDEPPGLERDLRRVRLYAKIGAAAHLAGRLEEVDKYTRLAMAYHYLGMEDREMYQKFYEVHSDALGTFLAAFSRDAEQLRSVEIYPSHPEHYVQRRELLHSALGLPDVDAPIDQTLAQPETTPRLLRRPVEQPDVPPTANSAAAAQIAAGDVAPMYAVEPATIDFWGLGS